MVRKIQQRVPAWLISVAVCLALVGSAVAPVAPVSAQSFVYDIGIDFPDYVTLWYWDQITIEITPAELASYLFGQAAVDAGSQSMVGGFAGARITADAGIDTVVDASVFNYPADPLSVGVSNAWAMESVSASGITQVSIAFKKAKPVAKLLGPGGNQIRATGVQVEAAGVIGENIVVPATGAGGLLWGSIYLQLDITDATKAGDYGSIVVVIKAENI